MNTDITELDPTEHAIAASPESAPGSGDSSFSERVGRLYTNFGGATINVPVCEEILDFLTDEGVLANSNVRHGPKELMADIEKWRGLSAKLFEIIEYVQPRANKPESNFRLLLYAALHSWDVEQFDALNGYMTMEAFAQTVLVPKTNAVRVGRKMVVKKTLEPLTKAAVNNAVLDAQKHFKLAPRKDQREQSARDNMSKTRNSKLKE